MFQCKITKMHKILNKMYIQAYLISTSKTHNLTNKNLPLFISNLFFTSNADICKNGFFCYVFDDSKRL